MSAGTSLTLLPTWTIEGSLILDLGREDCLKEWNEPNLYAVAYWRAGDNLKAAASVSASGRIGLGCFELADWLAYRPLIGAPVIFPLMLSSAASEIWRRCRLLR
jgi:hypothetical protein